MSKTGSLLLLFCLGLTPLLLFSSQDIRLTESGDQCIFPFTYNGKNFTDCLFSSENNKDWCFTTKDYKSWGFCKQKSDKKSSLEKEKKQELIFIKNMLPNRKESMCLSRSYQDQDSQILNNTISAVPCLENNKNVDDVLWIWKSPGYIKTSDNAYYLCNIGTKQPGLNKTLELCRKETNDDENDEEAIWYFDENGKIINIKTGSCIVLEKEQNSNVDKQIERNLVTGNCYDNDYDNREIWIKNLFIEDEREKMKLISEINSWKTNNQFLKEQLSKNQIIKKRMSTLVEVKKDLVDRIDAIKDLIKENADQVQYLKNLKKNPFQINSELFQKERDIKGVTFSLFPNVALLPSENKILSYISLDMAFPPKSLLENNELQKIMSRPFSGRFSSLFFSQGEGPYLVKCQKSEGLGLKLIINNKVIFDDWSNDQTNSGFNTIKLSKGDLHEIAGEFFSTQPHTAKFQIVLEPQERNIAFSDFLFLKKDVICSEPNSPAKYLDCPSFIEAPNASECMKFYQQGLVPYSGGRLRFASDANYTIENLIEMTPLAADGFITSIRFLDEKITDTTSSPGNNQNNEWYSFYSKTLQYQKDQTKNEFLTDIEINCSPYFKYKKNGDDSLENTIRNYQYGFSLRFNKKLQKYNQEQFYTDLFFSVIPLKVDIDKYQDSLGDNLLKNNDWSRSSCKGDKFIINFYKKSGFSQQPLQKIKRKPDRLVSCNDTLSSIKLEKAPMNGIVMKCPRKCSSKGAQAVFGAGFYHSQSTICSAAVHAGKITDSLGGDFLVHFGRAPEGIEYPSVFQNAIQSLELKANFSSEFFYIEANTGRECLLPNFLSGEAVHLNHKSFTSFLQVDEKTTGTNKESLVPSELISKMTNIINQNTEMIMKQNLEIKEVKEENNKLLQRLTEMEEGEYGVKSLESKLEIYSKQFDKLTQVITEMEFEEREHIKDFNMRIQVSSMKQLSQNKADVIIPNFEKEPSFEWQIIDSPNQNVNPSRWLRAECSIIEDANTGEICFTQSSPLTHNIDATAKPSSLLLYKVGLNELNQSKEFLFFSEFFFKGYCAFGFVMNYIDYENYDELLIEKTEYSSQVHFIQTRSGVSVKHHMTKICVGKQQSLDKIYEKCIELAFNQIHNITLIYYSTNVLIKFNNVEIGIFETLKFPPLGDGEGRLFPDKTFGLVSHSGNSAYFKRVSLERINIPNEVQKLLFGDTKNSPVNKLQTEIDGRQPGLKQEVEEIPLDLQSQSNIKVGRSMRFKQKFENKDGSTEENFLSGSNNKVPEDSIENIKITCLKYKGSSSSCTQALIAFDEFLSSPRTKEPDEDEIARVVYTKCLRFAGAIPLACSSAYKKAIEIFRLRSEKNGALTSRLLS